VEEYNVVHISVGDELRYQVKVHLFLDCTVCVHYIYILSCVFA